MTKETKLYCCACGRELDESSWNIMGYRTVIGDLKVRHVACPRELRANGVSEKQVVIGPLRIRVQ
jgi:hypothetical protein